MSSTASKRILVLSISLGWLAFWPAHSLAATEPPVRFDFETDAQYQERLQVLERLTNTSSPTKSVTNSSSTATPQKVQSTGSQMLVIPWWGIVIVVLLSVIWFYESHRRQLMSVLRRWQAERAAGWSSFQKPSLEKDIVTHHDPVSPPQVQAPVLLPIEPSPEKISHYLEPKLHGPRPGATPLTRVDGPTLQPRPEPVPAPGSTGSLPQTSIVTENLTTKPAVVSETESVSPSVGTKPRRVVQKKAILKPTSIRTKKVRVLSKKELQQTTE